MKKYQIAAIIAGLSMLCGCSLDNTCSSGETQCVEYNDSFYLESCVDGLWSRETNPCASGLCNDAKDACLAMDCGTGETECDQTKGVRKCDEHGQWGEYSLCEAGVGCTDDGMSCAECTSGEPYCDGTIMKICLQGTMNIIPDIMNYCKTCTDGARECTGTNKYKECHGGEWTVNSCDSGESCSGGQCTTDGCKPSETICTDGKLTTCMESSEWGEAKDCETGNCRSATECGECRDNSTSCSNNNDGIGELQICFGGVKMNVACSTSCKADASDCGVCVSNETNCRDGLLKTCVEGKWDAGTTCENGCEDGGKTCKSSGVTEPADCKENAKKCEDRKVYVCNAGQWEWSLSCQNGCNEAGTDCATIVTSKCENGKTKCEENKQYLCKESDWAYQMDCPNGCDGDVCREDVIGSCRSGDTRCQSNDPEGGYGVLETCSNGNWVPQGCVGENSCDTAHNKCGECKNGKTKCEIDSEQTCANGLWGIAKKCTNGCDGDKCRVGGISTCRDGDTRCQSNDSKDGYGILETCNDGIWVSHGCVSANSCDIAHNKCGECVNGDTQCNNGIEQKCESGLWKDTGGKCGLTQSCTPGQKRCLSNNESGGGNLEICQSDGTWLGSSCIYSCNETQTDCGDCLNGKTICEDDRNGIGGIKTCANGTFTGSITRSCEVYSCNSDKTGCGVCKNGEERCPGLKKEVCTSGTWVKTNDYCITETCLAGDTRCESNNTNGYGILETCSNGTWLGSSCAKGVSCDPVHKKCGECLNGNYCRAENQTDVKLQCSHCENGLWLSVTCPANQAVTDCATLGGKDDYK